MGLYTKEAKENSRGSHSVVNGAAPAAAGISRYNQRAMSVVSYVSQLDPHQLLPTGLLWPMRLRTKSRACRLILWVGSFATAFNLLQLWILVLLSRIVAPKWCAFAFSGRDYFWSSYDYSPSWRIWLETISFSGDLERLAIVSLGVVSPVSPSCRICVMPFIFRVWLCLLDVLA